MTIFPRAVPPVATNSWSAPLRPPDRIESNPEAFPLKFDDDRRALIPRSHLAIYAFIETHRSVIAAVIDARRHPRLIRDLVRARR